MGLPKLATPIYEIKLHSQDKEIKYRPFLVKEEKLLLMAMESKEEQTMLSAIKTIINNCLEEGSVVDIDKLPLFDLEYWFLHLRAKSVGEDIELNFTCQSEECQHQTEYHLNINDVGLQIDPNHDPLIKLTDDIYVKMKYPSVKEFSLYGGQDQATDSIFQLIAQCMESIIQGEEVYETKLQSKKEVDEFILSLNQTQFKQIVEFFNTMPTLRHVINFNCEACQTQNIHVVQGVENFFLS